MSLVLKLKIFLSIFADRLRTRGFSWALLGVGKVLFRELLWICLFPFTIVLHLFGFRQLVVRVEHIGHLSVQPDTLLKELKLGRITRRRWFLAVPINRVANAHLLRYWCQYFPVVSNPLAAYLLGIMSSRFLLRENLSRYDSLYFGPQPVYEINTQWGKRPPILTLTACDESWGKKILAELGIEPGRWFICVHVREGGFLPGNEVIQSHRNASIENFIPAMRDIVSRGGICVRMGDATMTPLPYIDGVIDYARSHLKADRLDVLLCAKARFFLGCTSGLAFLSTIFGVPVAQANMIPLSTLGLRYTDISIPKLIWSRPLGRYLSFPEIFNSKVGGYFFTPQYTAEDLSVTENDPEDIRNLVLEMIEALDAADQECLSTPLYTSYKNLFTNSHYSYGAASRVGERFISRHRALLPST